jgi:putative ATP-binding cassette transporter
VDDALSFFRYAYDTFTSYRAVLNRLTGLLDAVEGADAMPRPAVTADGSLVAAERLTILTPPGEPLLRDLTLRVTPETPLLVQGPSGAGKTTLLRTIAGLWPFAEGRVTRPEQAASLFLAQKPYLPLGSLRTALHYPALPDGRNGAEEILRLCRLEHLIPRLDEEADWSRILSLGEQQRLSFGRAFLHRPQAVLLDEATSAMDEPLEAMMYSLLRTELPKTTVVSVGHRSTLRQFHTQVLACEGNGRWQLRPAEQEADT